MKDILYFNTLEDIKLTDMMRVSKKKEKHDYSKDYLTFEALESGTISFNIIPEIDTYSIDTLLYSTDNGDTWTTVDNENDRSEDITINVSVSAGDKILWKGSGDQFSNGIYDYDLDTVVGSFFSSTCRFNAYGNIMSLYYGDDFIENINVVENNLNYVFSRLFCDYTGTKPCLLVSAQNLILPTPKVGEFAYYSMFSGCTSLTTPPVISAAIVGSRSCQNMFSGCTSLTTAPILPATTLANNCYYQMFQGCTALTTVPSNMLPATTLAMYCYYYMFDGCTSITSAPELPATTLVQNCYYFMFQNCSNLNYIKAMFTTTPSSTYTYNWVSGVAATGTFIKNSAATWTTTGTNAVPSGWTVETADS